jgi:hypothetical protein
VASSAWGADLAAGDSITACAVDVVFDDDQRPVVYCSRSVEDAVSRDWLVATSITRRKDLDQVEILLDGKAYKMRCRVGLAEAGQRVLARVKRPGAPVAHQANVRFVGPLEPMPDQARESGRLIAGRPTLVRVARIDPTNNTITGHTSAGVRVRLQKMPARTVRPGDWHAAVAVSETGGAPDPGSFSQSSHRRSRRWSDPPFPLAPLSGPPSLCPEPRTRPDRAVALESMPRRLRYIAALQAADAHDLGLLFDLLRT